MAMSKERMCTRWWVRKLGHFSNEASFRDRKKTLANKKLIQPARWWRFMMMVLFKGTNFAFQKDAKGKKVCNAAMMSFPIPQIGKFVAPTGGFLYVCKCPELGRFDWEMTERKREPWLGHRFFWERLTGFFWSEGSSRRSMQCEVAEKSLPF